MARVFISYARAAAAQINDLAQDLRQLGHDVWYDQDLSGGQAWWDHILERIRDADVFIFALDTRSLASKACSLESEYAFSVGVPVLPVLMANDVSIKLLPPALQRLHLIDLSVADRASALALGRAFAELPARRPLPDPLPGPPEAPISFLGLISERIASAETLDTEAQSALVTDLRVGLRDAETHTEALALLKQLRMRNDLLRVIDTEIEELLERHQPGAAVWGRLRPSWAMRHEKSESYIPETKARIKWKVRFVTSLAMGFVGWAIAWISHHLYQPDAPLTLSIPYKTYGGATVFMFWLTGFIAGPRRTHILASLAGLLVGVGGLINEFIQSPSNHHWRDFGAVYAPAGAFAGVIFFIIYHRIRDRLRRLRN